VTHTARREELEDAGNQSQTSNILVEYKMDLKEKWRSG
jgi:hypothetical protein